MLNKKVSVISMSIVIFLSAFVSNAYGATIPTFPVCASPQGSVKSSYDSGTHGVPGDSNSYSGKDTVYSLTENTLTQCLCPVNGNGIQTNWFKVSGKTADEINVLISEGWILISNGSAWGLDSAPYLAKNSSYSCTSATGGTSDSKSEGASVTQSILSLASTGNTMFILGVFLTGIALLGTGIASSFKKRG